LEWSLVFVMYGEIAIMKCRILAGLFSAALLAGTAAGLQAGLTHNPYATIVDRNAFALVPLPPPPEPPTNSVPRVDVFLTGISTVGGTEEVLLQVADKTPGKKTEYLPPLRKNGVHGRVEVVSIDADKGAVVIRVDGNERTLTFEKDAPKAGGAAPPVRPSMPNPLMRTTGLVPSPPSTVRGFHEARPLIPAFSPGGGEGARRAVEGDSE
jgi:hypothetical protein